MKETSMPVHLFTPDGMLQPTPYHHVAVGTGSRQVHVAGQVARSADGTPLAAGDLAGQVEHALRNTAVGLAGAGASFADVLRLTFYVVRWEPGQIEPFTAGIQRVADEIGLPMPLPPASLIGVDYLFEPDVLVEVEATAVLD
jgi:enamine deaminase RidA (YjgF/YER057c/UK114 family)